jgi:hypothetical protein
MAVQLFSVRNDRANDDLDENFFEFYKKWRNDTDATHLGIYFNMKGIKFHQRFSKK